MAAARIVRSPSAALRLQSVRHWLEAQPADRQTLILAPNRSSADELVQMLAHTRGALFGPVRLTLERLAGLLASDHLLAAGLAPGRGLALEALTARVLHRIGEQLAYFAAVRDLPGFPAALTATIVELRSNRISPDALAAQGESGAALAMVLTEFEAELTGAGLADRAAIFTAACAALRGPPLPSLAGLPLLLVDIPIKCVLEQELIAALAALAPEVLATVPAGDDATATRLEAALASVSEDLAPSQSRSLDRLQQHLLAASAPQPLPLDDSVRVVSAPGELHECVEIARRIQAEAAHGMPFDRMAILCHAPERYGAYLEEALARAGIAAYFVAGTRLPEPGGRALLALLACAAENLSARRFADYLSLAQVPDPRFQTDQPAPAPGDLFAAPLAADIELPLVPPEVEPLSADPIPTVAGAVRAPWRWERILVDSAVIGSQERWVRRLAGWRAELARQREECLAEGEEQRASAIERRALDLSHLEAVALPIIAHLAQAPRAAPWSQWLSWLAELVRIAVRDREAVTAALTELEPLGSVGPIALDELRVVLSQRLGRLHCPPARRRWGAVFVATPEQARGLSFELVLAPGLAERGFPKKLTEDPLLPDAMRERLSPWLSRQSDRVGNERLALRLVAGAANARVMFSYPRLDLEQGRPRVPSFYALEVLRAAEGRLPGFVELARRAACEDGARLGWPAPADPNDAIDCAEFDLAVLDRLLDADPQATVGAAHYLLAESTNEYLPRALRARARRWFPRAWTVADGLVMGKNESETLAALAKHRPAARPYSPTALQHYAACPYRFLLHAIFRLEPRPEAQALELIDPLTRGSLTHAIQFELLTRLKAADLLPVSAAREARALEELDRVVVQVAAQWHDELAPAIERVWLDGIDSIRADLREWLRLFTLDPQAWCPERFELAFGLRERAQADPASTPEPVDIGGLKLRGAIDLIERGPGGQLRVTDHKTGKVRGEKDLIIGGGKILQPVLYSLVAEKLLNQPVGAGRLYYCTAAGGYQSRVVAIDAAARDAIGQFSAILDDALVQGFLPAAPASGARRNQSECDYCDYLRLCGPYEMQRTARKPKERLAALTALRQMR